MGKKQHSKDQLYLTPTEWQADWGGKKHALHLPWKTLPFNCCAISFRPFEVPMCTKDGSCFDLCNIVPYIKKFKRHPVTGDPLAAGGLTKLKFQKNAEGNYHCPVLFKIFNNHTHIVAIRTTGHVYCHEAVKELNLKAKCMRDLIDDTPFTRDDIITLQDPSDGSRRELTKFSHVTNNLKAEALKDNSKVRHTHATERVMQQIRAKDKAKDKEAAPPVATHSAAAGGGTITAGGAPGYAHAASSSGVASGAAPRWLQTTSAAAGSFTSTTLTPVTVNQIAELSEEEEARQRYDYLKTVKKQKGYVQLQTSLGSINLELHCDTVPMTCENFISLCERDYYRGLPFHRIIKNFMLQGGDPTGTGKGGESIWGGKFNDEVHPDEKHTVRGVVSMANSGPNTNGSQFFITYAKHPHLDNNYSVFGKVIDGFDTLDALERCQVNEKHRPLSEIRLQSVTVHANPLADQMIVFPSANGPPDIQG